MEINAFLTGGVAKNADVTVEINDKVAAHHSVKVAEISLEFQSLESDVQVSYV